MTETQPGASGNRESGGEFSTLVVDADPAVREGIASFARDRYENMHVAVEADAEAAIDRLASEPFDCVVVDPDALIDDPTEPLAALEEATADCPVVWLTDHGPSTLDDAFLEAGTTIVEKGADRTDWSFLFEKIRGAIQRDAIDSPDSDLFQTLIETASDGIYTLDATGRVVYLNESFAVMLGYEQGALFGVHASTVMAEGELERGQQLIQEILQDDDRVSDIMDMQMVTRSGEPITVSVHFRVLTTEDGTYDGVMGVVRDITERKRRERELQRQRDRLEEFASVVSHDLRGPLSVAKGYLETEMEDNDSELLTEVARAHEEMDQLISGLLELARQGRTVEEFQSVDLESVVVEEWTKLAPPAESDLEVALDGLTLQADPDRLRQLFQNLFRNAVEHGSTSPPSNTREDALEHAGPDVTVRVGQLEDRWGFCVEDDGPGIPADAGESVFDRSYTTSDEGSGFGLAIVKRIVQAHDWTITVEEAASGGARFEITPEEAPRHPRE